MRELIKFASGGITLLSAIVFGVPIALLAFGILGSSDRPKPHVREQGSCSIGTVAVGTIIDGATPGNERGATADVKSAPEKSHCVLYFLPGKWELAHGAAAGSTRTCRPTGASVTGMVDRIRTPGAIGLQVAQIDVCAVVVELGQWPALRSELGVR